jgi:hypothetical protein
VSSKCEVTAKKERKRKKRKIPKGSGPYL